eukprot:6265471-Amphidinium_carterae.7
MAGQSLMGARPLSALPFTTLADIVVSEENYAAVIQDFDHERNTASSSRPGYAGSSLLTKEDETVDTKESLVEASDGPNFACMPMMSPVRGSSYALSLNEKVLRARSMAPNSFIDDFVADESHYMTHMNLGSAPQRNWSLAMVGPLATGDVDVAYVGKGAQGFSSVDSCRCDILRTPDAEGLHCKQDRAVADTITRTSSGSGEMQTMRDDDIVDNVNTASSSLVETQIKGDDDFAYTDIVAQAGRGEMQIMRDDGSDLNVHILSSGTGERQIMRDDSFDLNDINISPARGEMHIMRVGSLSTCGVSSLADVLGHIMLVRTLLEGLVATGWGAFSFWALAGLKRALWHLLIGCASPLLVEPRWLRLPRQKRLFKRAPKG